MKRYNAILSKLGVTIPKHAKILDFGCGAGRTVYSLLDQGYSDVVGYDVKDYLELRAPEDRKYFYIKDPISVGKLLPFDENSFDLIISNQVLEHVMDQVTIFRELHRIMRVGGHSIHVFPARYRLIEGHIFVPFGSVFGHRWYYKIWAVAGIRNQFQINLTANETADRNAYYFVEGLNYVSSSCYKVVWDALGFDYKFVDQENFDTSERSLVRVIGQMNQILPIFGWLNRTFHTRRVYLRKR